MSGEGEEKWGGERGLGGGGRVCFIDMVDGSL